MRTILMQIVAFAFLFAICRSLATKVPGLYIDQITLGSTASGQMTYTTLGYNFQHSWRQTLPTIITLGLSLYNFQVPKAKMLSFISTETTNSSQLTINIKPDHSYAAFQYMAFTVLVITEDNDYVELLSLSDANASSSNYYITSAKFNFDNSNIVYSDSYQWITSNSPSGSYDNYWDYLYVSTTSSNDRQLKVSFSGDSTYRKGFKVIVLIIDSDLTNKYKETAEEGSAWTKSFNTNFGIDTGQYGKPEYTEYCMFGLVKIDLYYYSSSYGYTYGSSFLFQYNNQEVTDISTTLAYGVEIDASCFGKASSSNTAIIVGAVIGSIAFVIIVVCISFCCYKRYRYNQILRIQAGRDGIMRNPSREEIVVDVSQPRRLTLFHNNRGGWGVNVIKNQIQQDSEYKWEEPKVSNPGGKQCSVCLQGRTEIMTGCGHFFHLRCILSWLNKNNNCPNCRFTIKNQWFSLICKRCYKKALWINTTEMTRLSHNSPDSIQMFCTNCREIKQEDVHIIPYQLEE